MPPQLRPVPDQPERAILYLRQSVKKDDSVSLELQETAGRDYATKRGYEVIDVVSDPGRSGTTLKRRQVQATVERVERREADIIIVWRWSRLARSRRDFAVVCDEVATRGGRVESATEPIDVTTASGRLARGMMAEVAAWESEQRGEVWKEVHTKRRGDGVPATGGNRFGYQHEKGSNTYRIDPVTGPILAAMYRRYLAGDGFITIVKWLNGRGIPTLAGRPWRRQGVSDTLDSGFGAGLIIHGRRVRNTTTWQSGAHPAVIDPHEWDTYRRKRSIPRPNQGKEPKYHLSGFLRCGDCDSTMHANKLGGPVGYGYVCSRWMATRHCRCVTITRHRAEKAVFSWLSGLAADTDAAGRRHAMAVEERGNRRADADDVARRIARQVKRLHRLTLGWTEGLVPDSAYETSRDEIQQVIAGLTAEHDELKARMDAVPERPQMPEGLVTLWPDMSVQQRRTVLKPLLAAAVVCRPESRPKVRALAWVEIVTTWGERLIEDAPGEWVPKP